MPITAKALDVWGVERATRTGERRLLWSKSDSFGVSEWVPKHTIKFKASLLRHVRELLLTLPGFLHFVTPDTWWGELCHGGLPSASDDLRQPPWSLPTRCLQILPLGVSNGPQVRPLAWWSATQLSWPQSSPTRQISDLRLHISTRQRHLLFSETKAILHKLTHAPLFLPTSVCTFLLAKWHPTAHFASGVYPASVTPCTLCLHSPPPSPLRRQGTSHTSSNFN